MTEQKIVYRYNNNGTYLYNIIANVHTIGRMYIKDYHLKLLQTV